MVYYAPTLGLSNMLRNLDNNYLQTVASRQDANLTIEDGKCNENTPPIRGFPLGGV
jgi:hypothetical protein